MSNFSSKDLALGICAICYFSKKSCGQNCEFIDDNSHCVEMESLLKAADEMESELLENEKNDSLKDSEENF